MRVSSVGFVLLGAVCASSCAACSEEAAPDAPAQRPDEIRVLGLSGHDFKWAVSFGGPLFVGISKRGAKQFNALVSAKDKITKQQLKELREALADPKRALLAHGILTRIRPHDRNYWNRQGSKYGFLWQLAYQCEEKGTIRNMAPLTATRVNLLQQFWEKQLE